MEIHPSGGRHVSPSSTTAAAADEDPMHAWWESISKARSRIQTLTELLPGCHRPTVASLADSDRPALSPVAYSAVVSSLFLSPSSGSGSGSGSDPLCHWLYDTFLLLPSDPHLTSPSSPSPSSPSSPGSTSYASTAPPPPLPSQGLRPSYSLFTPPRLSPVEENLIWSRSLISPTPRFITPLVSPTRTMMARWRGLDLWSCHGIVGTTLEIYYKSISQMPPWSKVDFCRFAVAWAGQECSCQKELDCKDCDDNGEEVESIDGLRDGIKNGGEIVVVSEGVAKLDLEDGCCDNDEEKEIDSVEMELKKGGRISLPWELLQPTLRILGHCLLAPPRSLIQLDTGLVRPLRKPRLRRTPQNAMVVSERW